LPNIQISIWLIPPRVSIRLKNQIYDLLRV
jgi:hypothetical protein